MTDAEQGLGPRLWEGRQGDPFQDRAQECLPCPCGSPSVCSSLPLERWDEHARDGDTEGSELWTSKFGPGFLLDLTTE